MLTKEQLEARQKGIGGSDAAAICGKSPWATPLDVYMQKVNGSQVEENEAMLWGNLLEDVVAGEFSRRNNKQLIVTTETYRHQEYDWMLANVDRLIADECAGLEIKTTGSWGGKNWGSEGTDEIPAHYLLQVAHYCAVLDLDRFYIAVLIGGNTYKQYLYERDLCLEANLIGHLKKFWEHNVKLRVPPAPQCVADVLAVHGTDEPIVVSDEVMIDYQRYKELKKQASELEKQADELRTKIIMSAGRCGDVYDFTQSKICSIRKRTRAGIDSASLKKDLPEVAQKYTKESSYLEIR